MAEFFVFPYKHDSISDVEIAVRVAASQIVIGGCATAKESERYLPPAACLDNLDDAIRKARELVAALAEDWYEFLEVEGPAAAKTGTTHDGQPVLFCAYAAMPRGE